MRGARRATRSGWRARSASVINVIDPDVIVLGGGLSNIDRLYERVPHAVGAVRLLRSRRRRAWCAPMHGDSSGVRGAAWLWE